MRWIVHGSVSSRHAHEALVTALKRTGAEVAEVPRAGEGLTYEPSPEDESESERRLAEALPADVLFNFSPASLTPAQVERLRARGVTTIVWLPDAPLLFRVCDRHVAAAYDLVLQPGRADSIAFYERRLGVRSYAFPWWTDDGHFPYAYDPDSADIEVGFLGNCHTSRRADRYALLAGLPWKTRFFGRLERGAEDEAGIHAGFLERDQIAAALRRFRIAVNLSQTFVGMRTRFAYKALAHFGEYFFPSRLALYAATGLPTVSLTLPGSEKPFPALVTATTPAELSERIAVLIDDRDALVAASAAMRRDFETCLTADTRVALLHELLRSDREHGLEERAGLWREFGHAKAMPHISKPI